MSRVAFIQQELREYFSFMLLSAKLKEAGHEVDVFVIPNDGVLGRMMTDYELQDFNIIAFSSTTISFENDYNYAKYIKRCNPNVFIIFGGAHPTYNPDEVIKHDSIDAICIGEGLDAIVELADNYNIARIGMTNIKNIWCKWDTGRREDGKFYTENPIRPISNINDWPCPDYALYYDKYEELRNKPTKPAFIVRGCPYQCAFCYNPAFNKMYDDSYKLKITGTFDGLLEKKSSVFQCMDIDKAISEIKWLKETYRFTYLQFLSDNMTINKKWLKEFMKKYRESIKDTLVITFPDKYKTSDYKIYVDDIEVNPVKEYIMKIIPKPFFMNCRANEVTKEIVDILKESGCDRVDFGVEHGNVHIRNDILKRNMSDEQIINCGKWFKEAGIRVQTTNIFGVPDEDFNRAWESVKLNRQFTPEISKACILQPFKNTEVYEYAKRHRLLKDNMQYSGTVIQIGVKDNRSEETKIKVKNEKQIIKLSRLFDWFVKHPIIPRWLGYIICSLPFDYKFYYANILKEHGKKYKGIK